MAFWDKLLAKKEEKKEDNKGFDDVELSFPELKQQIKNSLININTIEDKEYADSVITAIRDVKEALESIINKELEKDLNNELRTNTDLARQALSNELKPLFELKKPETLISTREFVRNINSIIPKVKDILSKSVNLQVIFRNESNELNEMLDDLLSQASDLIEGLNERTSQFDAFNKLVNEIKVFDDALSKLEDIKNIEMDFRKKISSYERDKTFLTGEIARIKGIDAFTEISSSEKILNKSIQRKEDLENEMKELVGKFSRFLKKNVKDDEFVNALIKNPLELIVRKESAFNKLMNKIINDINSGIIELSEREKSKYLKLLSDDKINEYINEYKELVSKEELFKNKDFSLLKKLNAFERRLIELTSKVNNEVKQLDVFKDKISEQKREIDALKSKVEARARECYNENVILKI